MYSVRKFDKFASYDTKNRSKYLEIKDNFNKYQQLKESKLKKPDAYDPNLQLEIMKSRKTLQEEKNTEGLVSEGALENVTKEQNFCEGSRNKQRAIFLDSNNNKSFGFFISRNIKTKKRSTKFGAGAYKKTFYKSKVEKNSVQPFWNTNEGQDWYEKNGSKIPGITQEKLDSLHAVKRPTETPQSEHMDHISFDDERRQNTVDIIPENVEYEQDDM